MVLTVRGGFGMTYFVVWTYGGRESVWAFSHEDEAQAHFYELANEQPPHGALRFYAGDLRKSVSRGGCEDCPTISDCCDANRCARVDVRLPRG
jgi:hypothetical protein